MGGICGYSYGSTYVTYNLNVNNATSTNASATYVAAIAGTGAVANCYYDNQMSPVGGIDRSDQSGVAEGMSTSSMMGSTLFGGLIAGLNREFAVKFAFLISIPSILGSVVVELPEALKAGLPDGAAGPMIVGIIVAAVSGLVAIKTMIRIVSKKKLSYFSYYTWIVGAAVIIYAIAS